jgi:hypothetical protein
MATQNFSHIIAQPKGRFKYSNMGGWGELVLHLCPDANEIAAERAEQRCNSLSDLLAAEFRRIH